MTKKYEEVKHYIEEENDKGCKLETKKEDYINTHQDLDLRCKCGNPFTASFHRIKGQNKLQCNDCGHIASGEKQKNDGQEIYDYFMSKNLIPQFKASDYTGANQPLPYICKFHVTNEIQRISYSNLRKANNPVNIVKLIIIEISYDKNIKL